MQFMLLTIQSCGQMLASLRFVMRMKSVGVLQESEMPSLLL